MSAEITAKVSEMAAKAAPIGATIKFDVDGETIYLDGNGDANTVTNEDKEAECTVSITKENLDKILSGELNPMMAFMGGQIKIDGDMGVAMNLQSLFS